MYINDTHIIFYIIIAFLGAIVGQFVGWMNKRLPEYKKIFSREIFQEFKINPQINYKLIIVTMLIYIAILYRYGIQNTIIGNLNLIKYLVLTPMLLSAFIIDYKQQIIPNRLNLTIFEFGLIIAFLYGMSNVAITIDMLFGMIAGGGIFLIITLLGGLIFGKEALGFGDVKLMGALGLYFGFSNIIAIAIMSFLIGGILGIILIITKIKKKDEYIPFGPFIVIATFISIFIPFNILSKILLTIFTLGTYKN
mgnify:CR=1 FL=1